MARRMVLVCFFRMWRNMMSVCLCKPHSGGTEISGEKRSSSSQCMSQPDTLTHCRPGGYVVISWLDAWGQMGCACVCVFVCELDWALCLLAELGCAWEKVSWMLFNACALSQMSHCNGFVLCCKRQAYRWSVYREQGTINWLSCTELWPFYPHVVIDIIISQMLRMVSPPSHSWVTYFLT